MWIVLILLKLGIAAYLSGLVFMTLDVLEGIWYMLYMCSHFLRSCAWFTVQSVDFFYTFDNNIMYLQLNLTRTLMSFRLKTRCYWNGGIFISCKSGMLWKQDCHCICFYLWNCITKVPSFFRLPLDDSVLELDLPSLPNSCLIKCFPMPGTACYRFTKCVRQFHNLFLF